MGEKSGSPGVLLCDFGQVALPLWAFTVEQWTSLRLPGGEGCSEDKGDRQRALPQGCSARLFTPFSLASSLPVPAAQALAPIQSLTLALTSKRTSEMALAALRRELP